MIYDFCVNSLLVDDITQMQLLRQMTGQFQAKYEPYLLLQPTLAHIWNQHDCIAFMDNCNNICSVAVWV